MVSTQSRSRGVWLATAEDLDTVVEVLVDSHVDYAWERWALPGTDRPQRLSRLYSAMLRTLALPQGEVWMSSCGRSVAVWLPASAQTRLGSKEIRMLGTAAADAFGARLPIIGKVDEIVATRRPTAEWHLVTMGTSPTAQGQGLGTEVLGPRLTALDEDGAGAVLETSDPRNLGFYGRVGFAVVAELEALPHGAPTTWVMERAHRAGRRGQPDPGTTRPLS